MSEPEAPTATSTKDAGHHLGRHFRLVTAATSISRVTGFLRDSLNAALFGAGWISDSYFMAMRIPSLLRDLFAEGALSNAFIPAFTARLEKEDHRDAWELMSQVFTLLCLVTGALVALGIIFAPQVVWIIAHGFLADADKFQLTVRLTRLLFPILMFVSFAALWMGALNSMHRFTAPAFAPVFMNLTQIVAGLVLIKFCPAGSNTVEEIRNVRLWAASMTLGMLLQWIVQVPDSRKAGVRIRWAWPPDHPGVREMLKLMAPTVLSQSVFQINLLITQFFASFLTAGYVSLLYYGNRLFQLPFGILGVSIATVTFPLLARQSNSGKMGEFSETLSRALAACLFFMVPCTVGILVVAQPACHLAFQYGMFTPEATKATAEATIFYSLGLVGVAGVKILLPAYFARRKARWTLITSMVSIAMNVLLNGAAFLLVTDSHYRFWGLALAPGLSAFINLALLLSGLGKMEVHLLWGFLVREMGKTIFASLVMGLTSWAILQGVEALHLPLARLLNFLLPVSVGAFLYFWLAKVLKMTGLQWALGRRGGEVS